MDATLLVSGELTGSPDADYKNDLSCFDPFTAALIVSRATRMVGKARLTHSHISDLIQTLATDLIARTPEYHPDSGTWEGFVVVVVHNCCATILEHRYAGKRSPVREAYSLNKKATDEDGEDCQRRDLLTENQFYARTGGMPRSREEAWALSDDVSAVIDSMPPMMRKVCLLWLCHESKRKVHRELKLSKEHFYDLLYRIRVRFQKSGLDSYLK